MAVWRFASKRLRLPYERGDLHHFLLLAGGDQNTIVRLALLVYAVYTTVHHLRSRDARADGDVEHYLWERIRAACLHNRKCAERVRLLWLPVPET